MTKKLQKKFVELKKVRIPLRKLIHGFEIREAAENIKNFRLKLLEEELMQGAKLTVKMDTYGEAQLHASRLETDKEYEARLESYRLAEEAKKERAIKRKLMEAERAKKLEAERKQNVAQRAREMALSNGISVEELTEMLKSA
jgi:hypothetical protein